MRSFQKKEAEIVALADSIRTGLRKNLAIFPAPPVISTGIGIKRNQFITARNGAMSASAIAQTAVTEKDDALSTLADAMKSDLRYAENTVDFDDDKLKLIGWAGRKAKTPLTPPGQVRMLEAPKQGAGWVFLDWKQPAAYKVQRRNRPAGLWADVATAILSEITLVDQPEKTEIEYRVIAINKSGEGPESNVVEVVL